MEVADAALWVAVPDTGVWRPHPHLYACGRARASRRGAPPARTTLMRTEPSMSTTASKPSVHPAAAATAPITFLGVAAQQHMLLLFFPLKKGLLHTALDGAQKSLLPKTKAPKTAAVGGGPDPRVATGVHFSMFYGLPADTQPVPGMPVPTF